MNAPTNPKAPASAPAPKEPAAPAAAASAAPTPVPVPPVQAPNPPLARTAEKAPATNAAKASAKAAPAKGAPAKRPVAKTAAAKTAAAKTSIAKAALPKTVKPKTKVSPAKKIAAKPVVADPKAKPDLAKPVIVKPAPASSAPMSSAPAPAAAARASAASLAAAKAENVVGYQEAIDLSKVTVEALVQSSSAFARGMQDMSKEVMSAAQASIEDTVAISKAMFAVRTIRELIDLQSSFARQSFDRLMADTGRLSERGVKVAEETFAPINASLSVAVDKFAKSAA